MDRFRQARDKGGAYLLTQLRDDGSFGSPKLGATEYYKVPSAFLVCGESSAANRLLNWVRLKGKTPDGDFVPRPPDAEQDYFYSYFNTWLVIGAHRLGQFDLAEEGMEFLMGFWNPESGGFYSSYGERGRRHQGGPVGRQRMRPGRSIHRQDRRGQRRGAAGWSG